MNAQLTRRNVCANRSISRFGAERGFSLPELMIAMLITITIMTIVFAVMRQNQDIFKTETGVTSMNENVRAAVDLVTREVQAAGTGLRGFSAPILGVNSRGERGDRIAIMYGDSYAPISVVRPGILGTDGVTSVALLRPSGLPDPPALAYRDERGQTRPLYQPGDRYVLYGTTSGRFKIVRVLSWSAATTGEIVVSFVEDESNPRPRFGDFRYDPASDGNDALFARLDSIVNYRWDRETETLERRVNHEPWATVARGIVGFQVRYRVAGDDNTISDPLDEPPPDRSDIRSVVVTLRARTPDVDTSSPYYRETSERFEITPRNMRLPRGRDGDVDNS